jgi:hypothetical protein
MPQSRATLEGRRSGLLRSIADLKAMRPGSDRRCRVASRQTQLSLF